MQESALSGVQPVPLREAQPRPRTWRYMAITGHALTVSAALLLGLSVVLAGTESTGLAFAIPIVTLTTAALASVLWMGRRAQWFSGFIGLALVLLVAPGLGHLVFDSFFDFAPILMAFVGAAVALVAATAELTRRPEPGEGTRNLLTIGGGVALAGLVTVSAVSGVVTLTGKSTLTDAERAGSTPVAMKDFQFAPETLTVSAGSEARIALKNSDPVIHDLSVKDLDLKVTVKPGSEKLFTFTAPEAGEYKIICSLHSGMDAKLVVTGD